jgi:CRP/FNR family transcriptional regulator, cyclic AMP receptor protein
MACTDNRLANILQRTPLFAKLTRPEVLSLANRARLRHYARKELLFSEGEKCDGLFVVATGLVRIFKVSPSGREHVLSAEGPGASMAELPVFDGGVYPASAVASIDSEVVFISRDEFRLLCLDHPQMALRVLEVVGERLRRLVGIVEELSFTTVRQRLIRYLLKKAHGKGRNVGPVCVLTIEANYQAIAAEIGTVRDLVARNLARLQIQGLLTINGREITIPDLRRLEQEIPR